MVSDPILEQYDYLRWLSLNPCSNGIWSLTLIEFSEEISRPSLNPCSNGIWSLTISDWKFHQDYLRS